MMKICTRCVMDSTAEEITFNDKGECNFCSDFLSKSQKYEINKSNLLEFVETVKLAGKGKKYDCIVGLSGGLDSSYTLVKVVELGLRPLAVHMDNGWNSELATNNIKNLVNKLNIDLYTHVIDWVEYRKLMQAFFDADVLDIELLYDNAMLAVNYRLAKKFGIKYILAGTNHATEGFSMPKNWHWFKYDKKNIFAIAKRFSDVKIKSMPTIGVAGYMRNRFFLKISWVSFLDYFDYNKDESLKTLTEEFDYKPYPYKHYESIFTRFYQGYILPNKFNVDKRKMHLSNLICSSQLSRAEAIEILQHIPYQSQANLEQDKAYFLKKMGWSIDDLENYISKPEIKHDFYPSEINLWHNIFRIRSKFKRK